MQMESVALTAFLFNKQPARAVRDGQPSSDFVGLRHTYSVSGEGTQYAYYKAGNSKVKNKGGSAHGWWERSPRSGHSVSFCYVASGGGANYYSASNSSGVAFGFCV
jgi:hypothetical protein